LDNFFKLKAGTGEEGMTQTGSQHHTFTASIPAKKTKDMPSRMRAPHPPMPNEDGPVITYATTMKDVEGNRTYKTLSK
jgi:hypothetical protein